jgi:hypothetical protein
MRRFLNLLGALTLIVIVVGGIGVGVLVYTGRALDAESKAFVDSAVPAIITGGSEQLLERATPELREVAKPDELKALFNGLAQLGPLVKYEGATGQALMSYIASTGGAISAFYVAKARFQNGSANFQIRLMRHDGHWMIHNFHIEFPPGTHLGTPSNSQKAGLGGTREGGAERFLSSTPEPGFASPMNSSFYC